MSELIKDNRILQLFAKLKSHFGEGVLVIKDYWEADLCAIGLTVRSSDILAYISTYKLPANRYYLSVERLSALPDTSDYEMLETFEKISFSHLLTLLESFWGITQSSLNE